MNSEAARQGRPATTSAAVEITTAAGREPTVGIACWTPADAAELDVLAHALVFDFWGAPPTLRGVSARAVSAL